MALFFVLLFVLLAGSVFASMAAAGGPLGPVLFGIWPILTLGALARMRFGRHGHRWRPTMLRVEGGAIHLGTRRWIATDAVQVAYLDPFDPKGPVVRIGGGSSRGRLEVRASSVEEARSLLDAIGHSARLRPMTFAFFFGMRVTVGADGVLVAWPLLRRRVFIPHGEIVAVEETLHDAVTLVRAHAPPYVVFTHAALSGAFGAGEASRRRAILLERIREARAGYLREHEDAAPAALLARGSRAALPWIRSARGTLGASGGDAYRGTTLPPDTLLRVAVDASAAPDVRAGAAAALRDHLDDDARARLRVAADASASPLVRVALSRVAAGDGDEALAAALDEAAPETLAR